LRYTYEEATRGQVSHPASELRPQMLAALPLELRRDLANALNTLDTERIAAVVHRVSQRDASLGGVLALYAGRFAYTQILNALEVSMSVTKDA
jgi:hypothetical protein